MQAPFIENQSCGQTSKEPQAASPLPHEGTKTQGPGSWKDCRDDTASQDGQAKSPTPPMALPIPDEGTRLAWSSVTYRWHLSLLLTRPRFLGPLCSLPLAHFQLPLSWFPSLASQWPSSGLLESLPDPGFPLHGQHCPHCILQGAA